MGSALNGGQRLDTRLFQLVGDFWLASATSVRWKSAEPRDCDTSLLGGLF